MSYSADVPQHRRETTRRRFLAESVTASAAAGLASSLGFSGHVHAAGSDALKIALIGCGGRGNGAASDALHSKGPIRLIAVADVMKERVERSLQALGQSPEIRDQIDVDPDHRFVGFDAYQEVMATDADIVLLATPPAFRPLHYAAAIAAGKHVFMEKPCCVDGPGYRMLMKSNKLADEKGLKVVVGLQRRHQESYINGIKRVHEGEVGDIILMRTYFNMPAGGPNYNRRPDGMSEMEWQIRRWNMFTWLSGDHIVEQAVHEIDIANWMNKDVPPVKANGLGGRQVRIGCGNGQIFDHHFVEYTYDDGARHYAQAKQQPGGWAHVSDNVHGSKGMLTVGSGPYGMGGSADYSGGERRSRRTRMTSPYRQEHQDLVDAIRSGTPLNDGHHGAISSMTAVLGRMATYSGDEVTWEEATQSTLDLAPGLDQYTLASTPPVVPDADGNYPIAVPGTTKAW
jgi:predicted dehydrogenase